MELDHLCRNPGCVNPFHMELVTGAENRRRSRNRFFAEAPHGRVRKYNQGCRCTECVEANRVYREKAKPAVRRRYKRRKEKPSIPLAASAPPWPLVEVVEEATPLPASGPDDVVLVERIPNPKRRWVCGCAACVALGQGKRIALTSEPEKVWMKTKDGIRLVSS